MVQKKSASVEVDYSHPALSLQYVDLDIVAQLVKFPPYLPTEKEPYLSMLKPLRSNFIYSFVYNWLSVFRGAIKMGADNFNINIWEEELVGLTLPLVFMDRLKIMLLNAVVKPALRVKLVEDFDQSVIDYLGEELIALLEIHGIDLSDFADDDEPNVPDEDFEIQEPAYDDRDHDEDYVEKGYEEDDDDVQMDDYNEAPQVEEKVVEKKFRFFDFLPLQAKIDVLYALILRVCDRESFKSFIEKFEKPVDLRLDPLYTRTVHTKVPIVSHSYFLLDDNRLYLRKLTFNKKVKIPKSGSKLQNFDPYTALEDIDPDLEWECLTHNFYEMYNLIQDYKRKPQLRKLGLLLGNMVDDFAALDLRWKKNYQHRLRERNMQNLIMNRKRSSRLQEKEERRRQEAQEKKIEQERLIREGAAIRAAKRIKLKEEKERERIERLNLRHEMIPNVNDQHDVAADSGKSETVLKTESGPKIENEPKAEIDESIKTDASHNDTEHQPIGIDNKFINTDSKPIDFDNKPIGNASNKYISNESIKPTEDKPVEDKLTENKLTEEQSTTKPSQLLTDIAAPSSSTGPIEESSTQTVTGPVPTRED